MTTRSKLYVTSFVSSSMMMLSVFSKPLHIPELIQWVLLISMFIPLGLTLYFIKQQKLENRAQAVAGGALMQPPPEKQRSVKRQLVFLMVLGSAAGLCSPLWLPLTGTSLGFWGDLACGILSAIVLCSILGFKLRKL